MISWKYTFDLVCRELDLTKKKKQVLNDLFATARISQSTHEYIAGELAEVTSELESRQKSLVDKMNARADTLEKQMRSLELFLANLEIHHATGELDEDTYSCQNGAITLGLEATKKELDDIRSSIMKITPTTVGKPEVTPEPTAEVKVAEVVSESVPVSPAETIPIQEVPGEVATTGGIESIEIAETEPPTLVMPQEESSSDTGSQTL